MALSAHSKIGLFTLIAMVVLAIVIVWKTEIFLVKAGYKLTGSFNSIEGLTLGSEIRYRGFSVGKVMNIDPGPQEILVTCVISKNIKFPADSRLRVAYDGIVGQKYLEIVPGTSEAIYQPPMVIYGIKTAGIVDFVDIGAKNLEETKKILENLREIIENPKLHAAILNTSFNAEKLTEELRQTNQGIKSIVADPKFQDSVKGTIHETAKTLTSANKFFESMGKLDMRASGRLDVGSRANAIAGDIDIVQSDSNYLRFGIGEGQTTRQLSLTDVLFNQKASDRYGYRIGVINNQLGGGLAMYPTKAITLRGDIYDINNPRPNWPKLRLGYEYAMENYMDMLLTGDDLLNFGNRNVTLGIRVRPPGERFF